MRLLPKFVTLVGFSFTDALHFRFVQAVKFVLILLLLSMHMLAPAQQFFQSRIRLWHFASYVSNDSPQPGYQFSQSVSHPLKLSGMCVATGYPGGLLRHATVGLPQFDTPLFRRHYQLIDRLQIQLGISRMCDILFLNRCVDIDLSQFCFSDLFVFNGNRNRFGQQGQKFFRSYPLPPFRQARRV